MGIFGKHLFQNDSAIDTIEDLFELGANKFISRVLKGPVKYDETEIIIVGCLIDGIVNNVKYHYYGNRFNTFIKKNKTLSVKKHIPKIISLLKYAISSKSGLNKYMLRSSVYFHWQNQVIELIERLALNELNVTKPGIEINIDTEDFINKLQFTPIKGEWVLTVNPASKVTKFILLTDSNKEQVLTKFDVFRISKLVGNKVLTNVDLFRSNRRHQKQERCYRPIFSNIDIDYDWNFFTGILKKESDQTKISVFLCHSSSDKVKVKALYNKLVKSGINAWIDQKNLTGGEDWKLEIELALQRSHIVLICLTNNAINKIGFVQKEIKYALDKSEEYPEGMIYIIPLRLEECPVPERLKKFQRLDCFKRNSIPDLVKTLKTIEVTRFTENHGLLNYQ